MGLLGERLRDLRHEHGLTLRQVSERTGLSTALLSQLENGRTDPSVSTLRKLAQVFDAELASLFRDPDAPAVHHSRPGERYRMSAPAGSLAYERLTPGRGDLEVLHAELAPGEVNADEPLTHPSTEFIYVLDGELTVQVDGAEHAVTAGEAITFDGRQPHRYANTSARAARILTCLAPRSA